jgi:hypothetical protein
MRSKLLRIRLRDARRRRSSSDATGGPCRADRPDGSGPLRHTLTVKPIIKRRIAVPRRALPSLKEPPRNCSALRKPSNTRYGPTLSPVTRQPVSFQGTAFMRSCRPVMPLNNRRSRSRASRKAVSPPALRPCMHARQPFWGGPGGVVLCCNPALPQWQRMAVPRSTWLSASCSPRWCRQSGQAGRSTRSRCVA